jgi:hypothetical protein
MLTTNALGARVIGEWVERQFYGTFSDRATALICQGSTGTGKSAVTRALDSLFPKALVGRPVWAEEKPYTWVPRQMA